MSTKVSSYDQLGELGKAERAEGRTIVLANGTFDLIHVGHIRYLEAAKREGDVLVVLVNDDTSTRALKGEGRPVFPLVERLEILSALSAVDIVVPFSGTRLDEAIRALRPHVHAKGTDYAPDTVPEKDIDHEVGARVAIVGDPKNHSSSRLVGKTTPQVTPTPGWKGWLIRKRVVLGNGVLLLCALAARPTPGTLRAGGILVIFGLVLRAWAAGVLQKGSPPQESGPYRFVRHPLYVGSFVVGLGAVMASGLVNGAVPLYVILFAALYRWVMIEEERVMVGLHGDSYLRYCSRVHRVIPKWPGTREAGGRFSWKRLLAENKEFRAWAGVVLMALALVFKFTRR